MKFSISKHKLFSLNQTRFNFNESDPMNPTKVIDISWEEFYLDQYKQKFDVKVIKKIVISAKFYQQKYEIVSEFVQAFEFTIDSYVESDHHAYSTVISSDSHETIYMTIKSKYDLNNNNSSEQEITLFVNPSNFIAYYDYFSNKYINPNTSVCWYFQGNHGIDYREFDIAKIKPIFPEFYPYIDKDIDQYCQEFLSSSSNILIMLGPPGTGKSSFIKNLISKNKRKTMITYDNKLVMRDEFYQQFIVDDHDLLVIEDADQFLSADSENADSILNKFLSLSDGIIDVSSKKIIFTANISKSEIAPALLRPGRCYDIVNFRDLTKNEATKIAEVMNIQLTIEKNTYTLAEIMNNKENVVIKQTKVGF